MFQLTKMEAEYLVSENIIPLRSQFVILKENIGENKRNSRSQSAILKNKNRRGIHIKYLPYVFTEQGVAMLSSVLRSKRAVEVNITIMRAFVKIRNLIYSYKDLADKIARMERKYDKNIGEIFKILDNLGREENNKKEIGFKAAD